MPSRLAGSSLVALTPAQRGPYSAEREDSEADMLKWPAVLAVLLSFCFIGTVGSVMATDKQIRRYFDMPNGVGVVPQHVEAAILRQIPIGSGEPRVRRFLQSRNIGTDSQSRCQAVAAERQIRCDLGAGNRWGMLHETYTVQFTFDEFSRLTDVTALHRFRAGLGRSPVAH